MSGLLGGTLGNTGLDGVAWLSHTARPLRHTSASYGTNATSAKCRAGPPRKTSRVDVPTWQPCRPPAGVTSRSGVTSRYGIRIPSGAPVSVATRKAASKLSLEAAFTSEATRPILREVSRCMEDARVVRLCSGYER